MLQAAVPQPEPATSRENDTMSIHGHRHSRNQRRDALTHVAPCARLAISPLATSPTSPGRAKEPRRTRGPALLAAPMRAVTVKRAWGFNPVT